MNLNLHIPDFILSFIWETLDPAEATYSWRMNKDAEVLKVNLQVIESIIRNIKAEDRNDYPKSSLGNFERPFHDYSDKTDSFER